jgi:hypothetical protein
LQVLERTLEAIMYFTSAERSHFLLSVSHRIQPQVRRNHRFLAAVELAEAPRAQLEGASSNIPDGRFGVHCFIRYTWAVSTLTAFQRWCVRVHVCARSVQVLLYRIQLMFTQDTESYKARFRYMIENLFKEFV